MKEYQTDVGQWVSWFRFNPTATTSDPVYGTGPQRAWYNPVTVPVIIGEFQRPPLNIDDDGLYLVNQAHLIIDFNAFMQSTLVDPDSTGVNHLRDRVGFDNHLFTVSGFYPRGRVADYFLTISVDLVEVTQSSLYEDSAIPMFQGYLNAP